MGKWKIPALKAFSFPRMEVYPIPWVLKKGTQKVYCSEKYYLF